MKLSEAILLGSIGSEQGFGYESIFTASQKKCALGAALLARGIVVDRNRVGLIEVRKNWPWVDKVVPPPVDLHYYGRSASYIYSIIWKLNDIAKWTRPQIAAWVAKQEKLYDPITISEVAQCPSMINSPQPCEPSNDYEHVDKMT